MATNGQLPPVGGDNDPDLVNTGPVQAQPDNAMPNGADPPPPPLPDAEERLFTALLNIFQNMGFTAPNAAAEPETEANHQEDRHSVAAPQAVSHASRNRWQEDDGQDWSWDQSANTWNWNQDGKWGSDWRDDSYND